MAKKDNSSNAATPETLEAALAVIASHEEAIAEQGKVITEQNAHITKIESATASGSKKPTIVIGKKTYTINSGARVLGNTYSPNELAEDTDAACAVLDIEGQNILTLED